MLYLLKITNKWPYEGVDVPLKVNEPSQSRVLNPLISASLYLTLVNLYCFESFISGNIVSPPARYAPQNPKLPTSMILWLQLLAKARSCLEDKPEVPEIKM